MKNYPVVKMSVILQSAATVAIIGGCILFAFYQVGRIL